MWWFPEMGLPQIIYFNRIVHYKPSIVGYPHDYGNLRLSFTVSHCWFPWPSPIQVTPRQRARRRWRASPPWSKNLVHPWGQKKAVPQETIHRKWMETDDGNGWKWEIPCGFCGRCSECFFGSCGSEALMSTCSSVSNFEQVLDVSICQRERHNGFQWDVNVSWDDCSQ